MCGVAGLIGAPLKNHRDVFEDMLFFGTKRGIDSTGVAFLNGKDSVVVKNILLPWDIVTSEEYENISFNKYPFMMGHNRSATKGDISVKNAHPFQYENITLTHNGTLTGWWRLPGYKDFTTDSENICYCIAELGIEETYKLLQGAWTIVYFDHNNQSLNVITNGQRPFFFAYMKDQKGMVYASESWMLKVACENRGVEIEDTIFHLRPHELFTFILDKKNKVVTSMNKLKPYIPVFGGYSKGKQYKNPPFENKRASFPLMDDDTDLPPSGKVGDLMDSNVFDKTVGKQNCFFCAINMKYEYPEATFIDSTTSVCESCTDKAELTKVRLLGD